MERGGKESWMRGVGSNSKGRMRRRTRRRGTRRRRRRKRRGRRKGWTGR